VSRLRRAPLRRGDRGQASVELALLLPIVMVLLLAVLQVGLLARDVVLVTHASREAARAAATDPRPQAAEEAAASSSGLDANRLTVNVTGRGAPDGRVQAEVIYRAATRVPLIGRLVGDRLIRSAATMRVETPPQFPRISRSMGGLGPSEPVLVAS